MSESPFSRWFTLLQRELQEYRVSLLWTPLVTALLLVAVMLVSAVVANRIAAVGQAFIEVVTQDEAVSGMNITIQIDDEPNGGEADYRIETETSPVAEGEWNFSREWSFKPRGGADQPPSGEAPSDVVTAERLAPFNALLAVVSVLMSLVLVVVTVNYLLGCLYDDRRDRSILFWKSMPVSEWEVVLSKLIVALVVAPLVFLAATVLIQLASTLVAMLVVWRMDKDPFELVLGNLQFGQLLMQQVGSWLVTALWVAPVYAWLLVASAAARRSPFLAAVVPVVVLVLLEELLFGSDYLRSAIGNHIPHQVGGGTSAGFSLLGPEWSALSLLSLAGGLAVAVALVAGAVWLRRHRWEI
ncbi:ABC transporter permease subunit [Parahaliea mediterranea]|uniref:ABC-2 transporter permease n=1 Tax=Parahaliea mediterranea TaxID=651086 RepID=A0A939DDM2_9GAMM|nr:ABC transporter permease subunit [Parahaliea mediterranea]MBN7796165.1 ABC-2 transporter permease [Parahaliea mediterranea]